MTVDFSTFRKIKQSTEKKNIEKGRKFKIEILSEKSCLRYITMISTNTWCISAIVGKKGIRFMRNKKKT